jgi:ribose 5-phosphate isomerase A
MNYKQQAAEAAVELIESGMLIGLGHGSTLQFALNALAAKLKSGNLKDIRAVPCSSHTAEQAVKLGISLIDLNDQPRLDLTIDGADEVDPQFNLIKGGGGALLREKIVAQASTREVIIVDESKLSDALGTKYALPVEVVDFGWKAQLSFLESLGAKPTLRIKNEQPVRSDQGNLLIDCHFGPIADIHALASQLEARSGIVEHGLFIGLTTDLIVAGPEGLRHLKAKK